MPGRLGRLWRSGGRRAQVGERPQAETETAPAEDEGAVAAETADPDQDIGQRLEAARQRLRETIPRPEE